MQTFLVKKSFPASMKCLDSQRLFNQFEECLVILKANFGISDGYKNHPAAKMWRGYEHCLIAYAYYTIHERPARGGNSEATHRADARLAELRGSQWPLPPFEYPPWRHDLDFYRSHRSNLIRKDAAHYGPQFPGTPVLMPYLWMIPSEEVEEGYVRYISAPDKKRLEAGELTLPERLHDKVVYKCP